MAACGLNEKEIAFALELDIADVRRHYLAEIEQGLAVTTAHVGAALVRAAERGDVNAARFFLQARARWVTPTKVELTGKDGGPVEVEERRRVVESIVDLVRQGGQPSAPGKSNGKGKPPATDGQPGAIH